MYTEKQTFITLRQSIYEFGYFKKEEEKMIFVSILETNIKPWIKIPQKKNSQKRNSSLFLNHCQVPLMNPVYYIGWT